MLSKRARTVYIFVPLKLPRLAVFNARNASAMMPSNTKTPTRVSVLFFAMSDPILYYLHRTHGVENITAVRMKSIASTDNDENTTVRVVA